MFDNIFYSLGNLHAPIFRGLKNGAMSEGKQEQNLHAPIFRGLKNADVISESATLIIYMPRFLGD